VHGSNVKSWRSTAHTKLFFLQYAAVIKKKISSIYTALSLPHRRKSVQYTANNDTDTHTALASRSPQNTPQCLDNALWTYQHERTYISDRVSHGELFGARESSCPVTFVLLDVPERE
jgi:hypothetical protein